MEAANEGERLGEKERWYKWTILGKKKWKDVTIDKIYIYQVMGLLCLTSL